MNESILDSTAILAILDREPGAEKLSLEILSQAVISAVNLAEVQTVLVNRDIPPEEAWVDACSPVREVISFSREQAKLVGSLIKQTRLLGLSLGDRACLALGILRSVPVYTADRVWKKLKIGVEVRLLR
jgi:PIN domain nuclease of toxin-antitoxin system